MLNCVTYCEVLIFHFLITAHLLPCFPKIEQLRWQSGKNVRLWSCRLRFDSDSGQTNDFKIAIQNFPARRSVLKGQCGEQAGKFTCYAVGKGT